YVLVGNIGTPVVPIDVIADTGSDLNWVQCEPCDSCFPQNGLIYDPSNSTTYQNASCDSKGCQNLPDNSCDENSLCEYEYGYGDKSYTKGVLGTETYTLTDTSGNPVPLNGIYFGCGRNNGGIFSPETTGIMGLGGGPLSLVSQLKSNGFSYCLLPATSSTPSSTISFGELVSGPGAVTTPYAPGNGGTFYILQLNGITVGNNSVTNGGSTDTIFDSGTTLTLLESPFCNDVLSALSAAITATPVDDPNDQFSLCYNDDPQLQIPAMIIHFSGGDVTLNPANTFVFASDQLRCSVIVCDDDDAIYGNIFQATYGVAIDTVQQTVTLVPDYCGQQLDIQAPMYFPGGGGEYLIEFGMGSQAVQSIAIADTGSNLIWIQCQPCQQCFQQNNAIYDPTTSSTYANIPCTSDQCTSLQGTSCDNSNNCVYQAGYGDGSQTQGNIATETLTLGSTSLPGTVIGCGHDNYGTFSQYTEGIVGLGLGPGSLPIQLSSQSGGNFVYCLAPLTSQVQSTITFGSDAVVSGYSTPFSVGEGTFYELGLEGLTIGGYTIQASGGSEPIILDSGTTLTYLPTDVNQQVETALTNSISAQPVSDPSGSGLSPCYNSDGIQFPSAAVQFTNANVPLNTFNYFLDVGNGVSCSIFKDAGSGGLAIWGNIGQQDFQIGFNTGQQTVTFNPTDCT
ncbi:Asp domain-containing protein, partial [Cephalotus follicularis]